MTLAVRKVKREAKRVTAARKAARKLHAALLKALDAAVIRSVSPLKGPSERSAVLTLARERFERYSQQALSSDTPSDVLERLAGAIEAAYVDAQDDLDALAKELE